jgi:FkbM family methyltransferase
MKKLINRWLGNDRRVADLEDRLAKAKSEAARLKQERNELREAAARNAPFMNAPLARMLKAAPHVKLTPELLQQLVRQDAQVSFSQFGEDRAALFHLQQVKDKGIVVDIGAYHPFRFSNTFLFHLMGWKCVCVDASEESIALLNQVRPTDTNVCALVSDRSERMTFFAFAEGAWNTTNAATAPMLEARTQDGTKLVSSTEKEAIPISDLLDRTVHSNTIDLLDIDVEGMDERLLLGLDLRRHAPRIILAEVAEKVLHDSPLGMHLAGAGYTLKGHCGHTAVIVRDAP